MFRLKGKPFLVGISPSGWAGTLIRTRIAVSFLEFGVCNVQFLSLNMEVVESAMNDF
jgi:hypothetical protein